MALTVSTSKMCIWNHTNRRNNSGDPSTKELTADCSRRPSNFSKALAANLTKPWYLSGIRCRYPSLLSAVSLTHLTSCGFDASEHEYASMSRHARKVPTSFFHRFTQDACSFANKWAHGRLVSVLEGGYSDKALSSGTMAHILGLVDGGHGDAVSKTEERQPWWSKDNVNLVCISSTPHRLRVAQLLFPRLAGEIIKETSWPEDIPLDGRSRHNSVP